MAAKRGLLPSYRLHQASGQAIVTIEGRMFYLVLFDSPESRERYDRLLGEWQARGRYLGAAGLLEAAERKFSLLCASPSTMVRGLEDPDVDDNRENGDDARAGAGPQ